MEGEVTKPAKIKLEILETDNQGENHYFYIRDRSKGFFWFFNFVMKLEFNPKVISSDGVDAIYLLDEPGSYLHAAAQSKLCKKLKDLSADNYVIYCTHSHYLLDPDTIPISSIRIAEKVGTNFNISLFTIYEYDFKNGNKNAFQPIYDALQIKPFALEVASDKVIIVEGIYDFYCFNMFIGNGFHYLPSRDADSISYYISLMIGWNIRFNAIWDNDEEGRKKRAKAVESFGKDLSDKLLLLPLRGKQRKIILQNFIEGTDLNMIKQELDISQNSSFEKTIATLFYSKHKGKILSKISKATRLNFKTIKDQFNF